MIGLDHLREWCGRERRDSGAARVALCVKLCVALWAALWAAPPDGSRAMQAEAEG